MCPIGREELERLVVKPQLGHFPAIVLLLLFVLHRHGCSLHGTFDVQFAFGWSKSLGGRSRYAHRPLLLTFDMNLNVFMIEQGVVATVMRQTNIVWTILVAIGCLDVSLRQLLLTPREREDANLIRTWHEIPVSIRVTNLILIS